jgi:hypothetical protein
MIDYAERVEEVALLLNADFAVGDRQLIEILLAARLPVDLPYPWLVLETECYSLDLSSAWFNFGDNDAIALPQYRVRRPRAANTEIAAVLAERDRPALFVEPNFQAPVAVNYHVDLWPYLMQQCLRVRSTYPKARPINEGRLNILRASTKAVLDCRWREAPDAKPEYPSWLLYFAELLQRVSQDQRDWSMLLKNLIALATRRAYLFNRPVDSTDWEAVLRVIGNSVPVMNARLLRDIASSGRWKQLRGVYRDRDLLDEIKRMTENGVVYSHQGRWLLVNKEETGQDILDLLSGRLTL